MVSLIVLCCCCCAAQCVLSRAPHTNTHTIHIAILAGARGPQKLRKNDTMSAPFDLIFLLLSLALLELRAELRGAVAATAPHDPATAGHPAPLTPPAFPLPQWQAFTPSPIMRAVERPLLLLQPCPHAPT